MLKCVNGYERMKKLLLFAVLLAGCRPGGTPVVPPDQPLGRFYGTNRFCPVHVGNAELTVQDNGQVNGFAFSACPDDGGMTGIAGTFENNQFTGNLTQVGEPVRALSGTLTLDGDELSGRLTLAGSTFGLELTLLKQ